MPGTAMMISAIDNGGLCWNTTAVGKETDFDSPVTDVSMIKALISEHRKRQIWVGVEETRLASLGILKPQLAGLPRPDGQEMMADCGVIEVQYQFPAA